MKNKKFLIGGIIVILAMAYLVYTGFAGAATYYYEVNEILTQRSSLQGENVRVHGLVEPGSIETESQNTVVKFNIIDIEQDEKLPVVYRGIIPDTFKENGDIVAEGQLEATGVFEAHLLLAKCPSKYESETPTNRGY